MMRHVCLLSVILLLSLPCVAESDWITYNVFVSETMPETPIAQSPVIESFRVNPKIRQSGFSGDLVELLLECTAGWQCIETPALAFALKNGDTVSDGASWGYKEYSFIVREKKKDYVFGDIYVVDVFWKKEKQGVVLFSNKYGITAFATNVGKNGKFDSYWLSGKRGLFAKP